MAAKSALARQLQKLSAPQTSLLLKGKERKSLLFDHAEAAKLDRDVIFAYGTNGLDKLKRLNPLFSEFEKNLFNISHKHTERSVGDIEMNKKLDEKISHFLELLSPYFLMRAAHEAVEWLVYRFHIHLFNVDDLVGSVLPHYNTSTFVRVVQLLDLSDKNSRWAWLELVQTSGVHLEFAAIVNHFIADNGFRKFVCELAPKSLKAFEGDKSVAAPVISFSMLTVYCALDSMKAVTDNTIVFLFPYIVKGLKSNMSKYIASSYIVICKILTRVNLTDELVIKLLKIVFKHTHEELLKEAFELLLLAFQQQTLKKFPGELLKLILDQEDGVRHLASITANYDSHLLLNSIVKCSVPTTLELNLKTPSSDECKKVTRFCRNLLSHAKFDEKTVVCFFKSILEKFSNLAKLSSLDTKSLVNTTQDFLKQLESKYPEYFDKALRDFMEKEDIEDKEELCKLINSSVCSLRNQTLPDFKTTVVVGVNHANPDIRISAIGYVFQQLALKDFDEVDFVVDSLCQRMADDSPDVVREVLREPSTLLQFVEKRKVLSCFEHILEKPIDKKSEWYPVQMRCVDILCTHLADEELAFEIFIVLLPFIFPLNKSSIDGTMRILNSDLAKMLPIVDEPQYCAKLKLIEEKIDIYSLIHSAVNLIQDFIKNSDCVTRSKFLLLLKEKAKVSVSSLSRFVYVFACQYAFVSERDLTLQLILIQDLFTCFKKAAFSRRRYVADEIFFADEQYALTACINSLEENELHDSIVHYTLFNLTKHMQLGLVAGKNTLWFTAENSSRYTAFRISLTFFEFCFQELPTHENFYRGILKSVLECFMQSQHRYADYFLLLVVSNAFGIVSLDLQIAAVNWAIYLDRTFDDILISTAFLPCLLRAVSSQEASLREAVSCLITHILTKSSNFKNPIMLLLKHLKDHYEEISIDSNFCSVLISTWFESVVDNFGSNNSPLSIVLKDLIETVLNENVPNLIKHSTLFCLQHVDSLDILSALMPIINKYVACRGENKEQLDDNQILIFKFLMKKFTPKAAACFKENSPEINLPFKCLQLIEDYQDNSTVQTIILDLFSKDFFTAVPYPSVQKKILESVLDIYAQCTSNVWEYFKKVLRKLCTFAHLILEDFQQTTQECTTLREIKKAETSKNNAEEFDNKVWKRITILLELIQDKKSLHQRESLVPLLFNLLNKTLTFDSEPQVEYVKQLILTTIHNCCQYLGTSGLDERQFQVEVIVQNIRSSSNPKTHHQFLLLLNLAATMFPDYVLSHVMSIFTFMGSNLVRQDDSYSFQVISQTIETIVPSLLATSSCQEDNQNVESVIRVFVNCLSDIPTHRRLPLFSTLIMTLGPSKYLWILLGQIHDRYVDVFHDLTPEDIREGKIPPILNFALNFHTQFPPSVQMETCINLMNFLNKLPDSKKDLSSLSSEPFDVRTHTKQELQMYKYNLLSYLNAWLSFQTFIGSESCSGLEDMYELFLERALHYLEHQRTLKNEDVRNRLCPLLTDLVNYINTFMPCHLFIKVMYSLLKKSDAVIQKEAIDQLNTRIEQQYELFKESDTKYLLKLRKPLLKMVTSVHSTINQQTALYAIQLITKIAGSTHTSKFHKVLRVVIQILKDKQNDELVINALLCLAQLCSSLNVEVLPQLNILMPIIIDFLNDYNTLCLNDCLILGVLTAVLSFVENLGAFLSSYLQPLITGICILSTKYMEINKKTLHDRMSDVYSLIAKEIPLRVLLTALNECYPEIIRKEPNAVIPLMSLLEEKLNCSIYAETESCSLQLEQIFICALDFRNTHTALSVDTVADVETQILSALKTFVLKLSELRFPKFFQKIYQWTTANETRLKMRIYTYYNMTSKLSQGLKRFFTTAAKPYMKHAAAALDANNIFKVAEVEFSEHPKLLIQFINNILLTLSSFFQYSEELLDKEFFQHLMQPLIDQLENQYTEEDVYRERICDYLGPCIAHMMEATCRKRNQQCGTQQFEEIQKEYAVLRKEMNRQILMKTKHRSPVVRFAVLQVLNEVTSCLADNYLDLLPESIPTLHELLEDENAEVENACQSFITKMENVLGEPIREYFP